MIGGYAFYPARIPRRFHFTSVQTFRERAPLRASGQPPYGYNIKYCDRKNQCFQIDGDCSGIGDSVGDIARRLQGMSNALGRYVINVYNPHVMANATPDVYYLSDWMVDKRMRVAAASGTDVRKDFTGWSHLVACPANLGRVHHFLGIGITDTEARTIVESLTAVGTM